MPKRSGLTVVPGGLAPGLSLSNRKGKVAKNRPSVGLDRLSLYFPVTGFESDSRAWDRVASRAVGVSAGRAITRSSSVDAGGGASVFVGVEEHPELPYVVGKVEANPSRLLDPDGWGLAPLDSVVEVAGIMAACARELLSFEVDAGAVKVARADLARDFEVRNADSYQRALASIPRSYAKVQSLVADPSRNQALTLTVGTGKAGRVRSYNKWAETNGTAPDGTMRFEVEARKGWLRSLGAIESLEDLTTENMMQLVRNRWDWSGMGMEVSALDDVIGRVLGADGLSYAVKSRVIGELTIMAAGQTHPMSKDRKSRLNKVIRELGVVVEPGSLSTDAKVRSHLDFDLGTEVVCVSA